MEQGKGAAESAAHDSAQKYRILPVPSETSVHLSLSEVAHSKLKKGMLIRTSAPNTMKIFFFECVGVTSFPE